MIPVTQIYGRKASDGEMNWITAIAMAAFHIGAVARQFPALQVSQMADDLGCRARPALLRRPVLF